MRIIEYASLRVDRSVRMSEECNRLCDGVPTDVRSVVKVGRLAEHAQVLADIATEVLELAR
jgi:hypothetical protein